MGNYDGPVGFASDGIHYPVDADDNIDTTRPLRWVEGATYRDAEDGEPLHNDAHHQRDVSIDPSTLVIHDGGRDVYPVGTHVVSEDGVSYFVADEHGNRLDDRALNWDPETLTFKVAG